MGWGFDCYCWPWGGAFDWSCLPRGGDIWICLRPTWICLNVNLNERNWDRKYFSHVTLALYVLEIIIDVHKIENQIIKEFDRFISIFPINLEFFVVVDLNVFRHCSIEVNWNKEKPSRFFGQCKWSVYGPVAAMTALFKCYAFCSLCRKHELFQTLLIL